MSAHENQLEARQDSDGNMRIYDMSRVGCWIRSDTTMEIKQ